MIPLQTYRPGIPIYLVPHLEFELWGMKSDGSTYILAGREGWHRLVFACQVKPNLLETDPGPLDAGVP